MVEAELPQTQVQLYLVYKVRNSLQYVPWKGRKAVVSDWRTISTAVPLAEAEPALERFVERWEALGHFVWSTEI